ncbi:O-methyltransferase [Geopyxis carbonaria]|nr:O-methyltransferase [Geopyxis carbonaria]
MVPSTVKSMSDIDSLLAQLTDAVKGYKASIAADPSDANELVARRLVADASRNITAVTKDAEEGWIDWSLKMAEMPVLRMFIKWGVFDTIPAEGSITIKDLAAAVKVDEPLLVRLVNALVITGVLVRTSPGSIAHSVESGKYRTGNAYGEMYCMLFDEALVPYSRWPDYFAKYGAIEPTQQNHIPHSFSYGHPEMTCWEVIGSDPMRDAAFQKSMTLIGDMMPITGMYDLSWLVPHADSDRPLIVDVGGGKGQALKAFLAETPELQKGVCILQDRQFVIDIIKSEASEDMKSVQSMTHNFFEPQPVKKACIYYLRRILHDWSDKQSTRILKQLCDAMADDSRVLICDQVTSDPPSEMNVQLDLMMLNIGGKERSEKDFHKITRDAGLKVVAFHRVPGAASMAGGDFAVVECVRA